MFGKGLEKLLIGVGAIWLVVCSLQILIDFVNRHAVWIIIACLLLCTAAYLWRRFRVW